MKQLLTAIIMSMGTLGAHTIVTDLATDLATLQQLLATLDAQLPSSKLPSGSPALLGQIRAGTQLHKPTPSGKKALTPEQQAIINRLAKEYNKKSDYIIELIQELESALAQGGKRSINEINLQDPNLIKMVRRRLSTAYIEPEESAATEAEPTKRTIITAKDTALVDKLAEDIFKFYKKEFPTLTEQLARQTAVHLFEDNLASQWQFRNKTAERETLRFIKELLGLVPTTETPPPAGGSILSNLANKVSWLFGKQPAEQPASEEWQTT